MHLLLQFLYDSYETLQVYRSSSEDFCYIFHKIELSHFWGKSEKILGILCIYLFLQFYADFFETLLMFRSWSDGVHVFWI